MMSILSAETIELFEILFTFLPPRAISFLLEGQEDQTICHKNGICKKNCINYTLTHLPW